MKAWYAEDWRFRIEVLQVGEGNRAEECRLGLEPGDVFECTYGTPAAFCPTAFVHLFPLLEVVRCGGDLRNLGAASAHATTLRCPDGAVLFHLSGEPVPDAALAEE